jgi:hypothetical protein
MLLVAAFVFILATAPKTLVHLVSVTAMLLGGIALFSEPVAGFCECGYVAEIAAGSVANSFLFTDVLESDFLHIKNIKADTDWSIQNYDVSAAAARGPYG